MDALPQTPPLSEKLKAHALLSNFLTAFIYWVVSAVGLQLSAAYGNISPIWPSSGFAITAIYFGGYRLLPGILLGAIASYTSSGLDLLSALAIAFGNFSEAAIAAWLLNRARTWATYLGKYTTPLWILTTSILAPIASAMIGSLSIRYLSGTPDTLHLWQAALSWMAGNMIGILTIVPVILTLKRPQFSFNWFIKLTCLSALVFLIYALLWSQDSGISYLFLAFIPLIPASRCFGQTGCALYTLSFIVFASLAIFTNPTTNILASTNYQLFALDTFLITLSVTSLTIATIYRKGLSSIPCILFLLGWLSSGLIYNTLKNNSNTIDERNFVELIYDAEAAVSERLDTYIDALIASAGFYINSDELRPNEWQSFVNHLKLVERYPGINGIGFIQPFDEAALSSLVERQQAKGVLNFEIKNVPGVSRPPADAMGYEHYIITYIEPLDINYEALGLDVASEINRQTAGQRARDTGQAAMTDRITLVQDGKSRPGFLMFYPMYRPGSATDTIEQRREAFIGWSYAPFITEEFLKGVLGSREDQIQFDIYDSQHIAPSHFVYSTSGREPTQSPDSFEHTSTLKLTNQTFSFGWNHGSNFSKQETASATIAAASLSLGSCLLVVIVVNLQTTNRRAKRIVDKRTAELSEANDQLQREVKDKQAAELDAKQAHAVADAANLAKSEFLATMSHEIRTPMNSVIGFAELLSRSQLNNEQEQWTSYIQSSGNSLLSLINDILDFSKIEAGKLELERIPFSITDVIDEVVCSLIPIAEQKNLRITFNVGKNMPSNVIGDPVRLKQVVTNLLANAIKFTESGSATVSADWSGQATNGTAKITITDTGVGIPEDRIQNLFQRFAQVDSSTTRQYGGTGLGLAICKRIVNLMDGDIQVDHTDSHGTTISFNIPFSVSKQTEDKAQSTPDTSKTQSSNVANKRRVLVVDDNAVNRKLAETVLRRLGHEVDTANNGAEAIERVKERFYDIVFLDCQMPIMDGYEATRRMRKLETEGQIPQNTRNHALPIIALTANASGQEREACLNCGMDSYISKPAKIDDFKNAFKQLQER